MQSFHNRENKITAPFYKQLEQNIALVERLFSNCQDVIKRKLEIGGTYKISIYIVYIDGLVNRELVEEIILFNLINRMEALPKEDTFAYLQTKGFRTADISIIETMQKVTQGILSGDTVVFIDGYEKAFLISSKGFPSRGVPESKAEMVMRGSKDSFSEGFFINKVLIRRRIKDTNLKVVQYKIGIRSQTDVALMYMEDIAKESLIKDLDKKLNSFTIDGILDSGMLETLLEENWLTPFPQFQPTERPDKTASALLEGRVAIVVDNSPTVLLAPATLTSFFQASDDYYEKWEIGSFSRMLRYIAAFFATFLPALYIAIVNFHGELIPTELALSFAAARAGVPFSVITETILMEISFELLREAGIRLPGPMGNTIGIVGGLIIGSAAVTANLVSPLIVIVVAATAIASFAIPNESFASAFRLTRYTMILLASFLGLYGISIGMLLLLAHLANLKSFGIPYLMPYVSNKKTNEKRDALFCLPSFFLKKRPVFAKKGSKIRFTKK